MTGEADAPPHLGHGMKKKERIVSYTAEELDAMEARGEDRTDWPRVDATTEEQLAADTADDPAWDGLPEDWHGHARAASGPLIRPEENIKGPFRFSTGQKTAFLNASACHPEEATARCAITPARGG